MQVSKLGKLQCKSEGSSKQDLKAEDLRQMFLAMTEEVSFFNHIWTILSEKDLLLQLLLKIYVYIKNNAVGSCDHCQTGRQVA